MTKLVGKLGKGLPGYAGGAAIPSSRSLGAACAASTRSSGCCCRRGGARQQRCRPASRRAPLHRWAS
eukprot:3640990-Pleurochrysis_carterae.AAC.6